MSRPYTRVTLTRMLLLAIRLGSGGAVTLRYIMEAHGVSLATAKRDMVMLEAMLPVLNEPVERETTGGLPARQLRMMPNTPLLRLAAVD